MSSRATLWVGAITALLTASGGFATERVATGLASPVFLTARPGDTTRVFIVEQNTGSIRILRLSDRALLPTPFLTVPGVVAGGEQGLLGLAFHPNYAINGFFYVYYTDPDTRVVRYRVSLLDPDVADPASATPVLRFSRPQSNHNGGWIGFGPDGYLYIASGDGGASNDFGPGHTDGIGNAQDITDNLLGKILRIDVDGDDFALDMERNYSIPINNPFRNDGGDDEIWAYGLRNPWRASFDRSAGDLFIGDVGQGACEEIDVQRVTSPGGENYGWRLREGLIATPDPTVGGPKPPGAIDPIFNYPHPGTACGSPDHGPAFTGYAVVGGYVYRGPVAALQGRYFFADYGTAHLWSFVWDGSPPVQHDGSNFTDLVDHSTDPLWAPDVGELNLVSSFGEDAAGNLYVLDLDGDVFLLPEPAGALAIGVLAVLLLSRTRAQPASRDLM